MRLSDSRVSMQLCGLLAVLLACIVPGLSSFCPQQSALQALHRRHGPVAVPFKPLGGKSSTAPPLAVAVKSATSARPEQQLDVIGALQEHVTERGTDVVQWEVPSYMSLPAQRVYSPIFTADKLRWRLYLDLAAFHAAVVPLHLEAVEAETWPLWHTAYALYEMRLNSSQPGAPLFRTGTLGSFFGTTEQQCVSYRHGLPVETVAQLALHLKPDALLSRNGSLAMAVEIFASRASMFDARRLSLRMRAITLSHELEAEGIRNVVVIPKDHLAPGEAAQPDHVFAVGDEDVYLNSLDELKRHLGLDSLCSRLVWLLGSWVEALGQAWASAVPSPLVPVVQLAWSPVATAGAVAWRQLVDTAWQLRFGKTYTEHVSWSSVECAAYLGCVSLYRAAERAAGVEASTGGPRKWDGQEDDALHNICIPNFNDLHRACDESRGMLPDPSDSESEAGAQDPLRPYAEAGGLQMGPDLADIPPEIPGATALGALAARWLPAWVVALPLEVSVPGGILVLWLVLTSCLIVVYEYVEELAVAADSYQWPAGQPKDGRMRQNGSRRHGHGAGSHKRRHPKPSATPRHATSSTPTSQRPVNSNCSTQPAATSSHNTRTAHSSSSTSSSTTCTPVRRECRWSDEADVPCGQLQRQASLPSQPEVATRPQAVLRCISSGSSSSASRQADLAVAQQVAEAIAAQRQAEEQQAARRAAAQEDAALSRPPPPPVRVRQRRGTRNAPRGASDQEHDQSGQEELQQRHAESQVQQGPASLPAQQLQQQQQAARREQVQAARRAACSVWWRRLRDLLQHRNQAVAVPVRAVRAVLARAQLVPAAVRITCSCAACIVRAAVAVNVAVARLSLALAIWLQPENAEAGAALHGLSAELAGTGPRVRKPIAVAIPADSTAPESATPQASASTPVATPSSTCGSPARQLPGSCSDGCAADLDDDEDDGLCRLCMDGPRERGFMHGGCVHTGFCAPCAEAVMRRGPVPRCPLCRLEVEHVLKVY